MLSQQELKVISYELRILSGLHRGAILPLGSEPLTIGCHEDADIVLADPDIQHIHATVTPSDSGWIFTSNDGDVYSSNSPQKFKEIPVMSGEPVCIGSVWVGIFAEGDSWLAPPSQLPMSMPVSDYAIDAPPPATEAAHPAIDAAVHEEAAPPVRPANPLRRRKLMRVGAIPVLIGAIATAAAAYAFTTKPETVQDTKPHVQLEKERGGPAVTQAAPKPAGIPEKNENTVANAAVEQPSSPSSEDLKKAFRRKLSEAELIKRFDMQLDDASWTMRADLDDEEAARFERILKTFVAENKISFPINAKVVTAEGMLPFKIKQVTSGANASIVTTDGDRLYVGDELNGVRLASISGNKLTFSGNRKIEIRW
jgi:type III secretion protein D